MENIVSMGINRRACPAGDICMMTQFDYKFQNPSDFACLMLIRAIVIFTPLGIQNLNKKRKTK